MSDASANAEGVTREPTYGGELCIRRDGRGRVLEAWFEARGKADERRLTCKPDAGRGNLVHDPLYGGESYDEGRARLYLPDITISFRTLPYEAWVEEAIGYVRRVALVDAVRGLCASAARARGGEAGARALAGRAAKLLREQDLPRLHRATVELCLAVAAGRGANIDPRPHLDAAVAQFPAVLRGDLPLRAVKKSVGASWWQAHVTEPVLERVGARVDAAASAGLEAQESARQELATALESAVDLLGERALTKAALGWGQRILGGTSADALKAESLYALLGAVPSAAAKVLSLVDDAALGCLLPRP